MTPDDITKTPDEIIRMIHVAVFRPGQPVLFEEIPNTLTALQTMVDGCIEMLYISSKLVIVCNEEGKLNGLPFNRIVVSHGGGVDHLVGTFIVCRTAGEEFASILTRDKASLQGWEAGAAWVIA